MTDVSSSIANKGSDTWAHTQKTQCVLLGKPT